MMNASQKKLLIGLIVLALLAPLGIYLPSTFRADDAWGEWPARTLGKMLGYLPEGFKRHAGLLKAPIPDYNIGNEKSSFALQAVSYLLSGVIGIILCGVILFAISKFLVKKKE